MSLQLILSPDADPLGSQVAWPSMSFQIQLPLEAHIERLGFRSFQELTVRLEEKLIKFQVEVHRCKVKLNFHPGDEPFIPVTVNDPNLYRLFQNVATYMFGEKNAIEMQPEMRADDFSYFAKTIPGCFLYVGMQNMTGRKWNPLIHLISPSMKM